MLKHRRPATAAAGASRTTRCRQLVEMEDRSAVVDCVLVLRQAAWAARERLYRLHLCQSGTGRRPTPRSARPWSMRSRAASRRSPTACNSWPSQAYSGLTMPSSPKWIGRSVPRRWRNSAPCAACGRRWSSSSPSKASAQPAHKSGLAVRFPRILRIRHEQAPMGGRHARDAAAPDAAHLSCVTVAPMPDAVRAMSPETLGVLAASSAPTSRRASPGCAGCSPGGYRSQRLRPAPAPAPVHPERGSSGGFQSGRWWSWGSWLQSDQSRVSNTPSFLCSGDSSAMKRKAGAVPDRLASVIPLSRRAAGVGVRRARSADPRSSRRPRPSIR